MGRAAEKIVHAWVRGSRRISDLSIRQEDWGERISGNEPMRKDSLRIRAIEFDRNQKRVTGRSGKDGPRISRISRIKGGFSERALQSVQSCNPWF
jgi:hypothetical protein